MLPDLTFLVVVLTGGALGAALVGLIREIRGAVDDPARPPSLSARAAAAIRSPALAGRLAGAVLVGVFVLVVTRWPVAAVALALLVAAWPALFGGNRAEQRRISELEALVVWTETLRDTVAAHASLEQAIPTAAAHAPPIIAGPLRRLVGQMRMRMPMELALRNLSRELNDASADLVIAALILNVRRRGDRLGEVLTGLATTARQELEMRRQINAGRASLRRDVVVVVVVTLVIAGGMKLFAPDFLKPYGTPAGQIAMAVVAGVFAAGFAWMRRLSASEPIAPFLTRGDYQDSDEVRVVETLTGTTGPGRTTKQSWQR